MSYFDGAVKQDAGEQTPVYAMSFELYEDGVSRALTLDYNDFVIAGAMDKIDVKNRQALQIAGCRPPAVALRGLRFAPVPQGDGAILT